VHRIARAFQVLAEAHAVEDQQAGDVLLGVARARLADDGAHGGARQVLREHAAVKHLVKRWLFCHACLGKKASGV
jgi:hypothetical protein